MIKWSLSSSKPLKGIALADRSTKKLLQRLHGRAIAVIAHDDLDELAAQALKKAKVRAVVNAGRTMTGRISSRAVLLLLDQGIPIYEIDPLHFEAFGEQTEIAITTHGIALPSVLIPYTPFSRADWLSYDRTARMNEALQLSAFIDNTLFFAEREKDFMLKPLLRQPLRTSLAGRTVVVVVRGRGFQEDLDCLRDYINEAQPILMGVDGGADALIRQGYKPDLIVGDMDSVSDRALRAGAELIVHAYRDGTAPGMARLERLGLTAVTVSGGGTSEDMALLLAYDHDCEQIVSVGLHSHMQDFLEKGRNGMGSTWLVRMKVGHRLIDARGISRLYPYVGQSKRRIVYRAWGWGVQAAKAILDLCTPSAYHRKERESYGAPGIGHHSRLE